MFARGPAQVTETREVERRLLTMVIERTDGSPGVRYGEGNWYQGNEIVEKDGNRLWCVSGQGLDYRSIFWSIPVERAYYHRPRFCP